MVDVGVAYHISLLFYKSHVVVSDFTVVTGLLAVWQCGHMIMDGFWTVTDYDHGGSSKCWV